MRIKKKQNPSYYTIRGRQTTLHGSLLRVSPNTFLTLDPRTRSESFRSEILEEVGRRRPPFSNVLDEEEKLFEWLGRKEARLRTEYVLCRCVLVSLAHGSTAITASPHHLYLRDTAKSWPEPHCYRARASQPPSGPYRHLRSPLRFLPSVGRSVVRSGGDRRFAFPPWRTKRITLSPPFDPSIDAVRIYIPRRERENALSFSFSVKDSLRSRDRPTSFKSFSLSLSLSLSLEGAIDSCARNRTACSPFPRRGNWETGARR